MKIIEIAATRWHVLKLKCTKFDFGWGSAQTPLGSLQRSPDPLAGFKGPTSNGREEKKDGRAREGRGHTSKAIHRANHGTSLPPRDHRHRLDKYLDTLLANQPISDGE